MLKATVLGILLLTSGQLMAKETGGPCIRQCAPVCCTMRISDEMFQESIQTLGELVGIVSVSNPFSPDYSMENLYTASEYLIVKLKQLGLKVRSYSIEDSAPFVVAEYIVDPSKPTLLLYAHYDVQPVDRDKWHTDPFVMQEKDGRLYGRGASDDKAGAVAILYALKTCLTITGTLPCNVKLLFEGEEEYGSAHMQAFLDERGEELKADALIVLDGLNRDVDTGTLTSSTRGIVNIKLKVNALKQPVHSGIGCLAPDPAQALATLIASLSNPWNIAELMEGAQELHPQEKELLSRNSQSAESYAKDMGVLPEAQLRGDPEESIYERVVQEPSISIVNMNCGKPNGGNSIQDSAACIVGIRVVPGQNPDQVSKAMINHLKSQVVPYNLPIEALQEEKGAWAWKANLAGPFSQKYLEAMGQNFTRASAMPCGGALPLLHEFQAAFPKMEMLVPGVEDPNTCAHSHNESQDISVLRNSINSLISFFYKVGA